jgi:DNA (cytosine-5)-methyltransferase 1
MPPSRPEGFDYRVLPPAAFANHRSRPTAIDLFSGAGGLTLGLLNAGWDVRACADVSGACASTHHLNLPRIPMHLGDVSLLTGADLLRMARLKPGALDMLAGGPPCQGFSILGQREHADPRNQLFLDFMRLASELRPKVVLIENVPGLATLAGGAVLRDISTAFDRAGYDAACAELVAAQYGVPQLRWRMVFVGWRRDLGRGGGFPIPTHGRAGIGDLVPNRTLAAVHAEGFLSTREAIGDLPAVAAGKMAFRYAAGPSCSYQEAMREGCGREVDNHYAPRMSEANLARMRALKPGQDWRDLPYELLPPGMQRALRKDHTRRYRRMTWEGVPRSIITRFRDPKSGEYTHPEQHRTISIREAARIQSFPDWFRFTGSLSDQYDQVGNAVPPLMGRAIGAEILRALRSNEMAAQAPKSRYRLVTPNAAVGGRVAA